MDYEMSLILASYRMGMHESRVTDCYIKNPEKILEILDDFLRWQNRSRSAKLR